MVFQWMKGRTFSCQGNRCLCESRLHPHNSDGGNRAARCPWSRRRRAGGDDDPSEPAPLNARGRHAVGAVVADLPHTAMGRLAQGHTRPLVEELRKALVSEYKQ